MHVHKELGVGKLYLRNFNSIPLVSAFIDLLFYRPDPKPHVSMNASARFDVIAAAAIGSALFSAIPRTNVAGAYAGGFEFVDSFSRPRALICKCSVFMIGNSFAALDSMIIGRVAKSRASLHFGLREGKRKALAIWEYGGRTCF
jgi:hypothetical protein